MKLRKLATAGTLIALSCLAPTASAQGTAAAEALFQEGQAALERGDLDVACPKLRESDRLDPANGTKLNLADCEEKRGHLASAWELYRKLSDSLPAGDERLPYAQEHAQALGPRVPRLLLKLAAGAPADTEAKLGNAVLTSASFGTALPLDPGQHELVVMGGGGKRRYQIRLAEGDTKTLEITPQGEGAGPTIAGAPGAPAPPPSRSSDRGGDNTKTLGYVLGGVGLLGVGVGATAGIIGLNQQSTGDENCNDVRRVCSQAGIDANDKARTMRPISMVGFAVGIVGLGAGAYFIFTSSSDDKVALSGRMSADVASLNVTGRW